MALKGNKKRFEEEFFKAKKEADSEYTKEIDKNMKKFPTSYPDNQEPPNDPMFAEHYYKRAYNKESANSDDSGTTGSLAHRKGSKVMDAAGIFDMEEDLDKQEKEDERKKGARFSGLKKLLRGE